MKIPILTFEDLCDKSQREIFIDDHECYIAGFGAQSGDPLIIGKQSGHALYITKDSFDEFQPHLFRDTPEKGVTT